MKLMNLIIIALSIFLIYGDDNQRRQFVLSNLLHDPEELYVGKIGGGYSDGLANQLAGFNLTSCICNLGSQNLVKISGIQMITLFRTAYQYYGSFSILLIDPLPGTSLEKQDIIELPFIQKDQLLEFNLIPVGLVMKNSLNRSQKSQAFEYKIQYVAINTQNYDQLDTYFQINITNQASQWGLIRQKLMTDICPKRCEYCNTFDRCSSCNQNSTLINGDCVPNPGYQPYSYLSQFFKLKNQTITSQQKFYRKQVEIAQDFIGSSNIQKSFEFYYFNNYSLRFVGINLDFIYNGYDENDLLENGKHVLDQIIVCVKVGQYFTYEFVRTESGFQMVQVQSGFPLHCQSDDQLFEKYGERINKTDYNKDYYKSTYGNGDSVSIDWNQKQTRLMLKIPIAVFKAKTTDLYLNYYHYSQEDGKINSLQLLKCNFFVECDYQQFIRINKTWDESNSYVQLIPETSNKISLTLLGYYNNEIRSSAFLCKNLFCAEKKSIFAFEFNQFNYMKIVLNDDQLSGIMRINGIYYQSGSSSIRRMLSGEKILKVPYKQNQFIVGFRFTDNILEEDNISLQIDAVYIPSQKEQQLRGLSSQLTLPPVEFIGYQIKRNPSVQENDIVF